MLARQRSYGLLTDALDRAGTLEVWALDPDREYWRDRQCFRQVLEQLVLASFLARMEYSQPLGFSPIPLPLHNSTRRSRSALVMTDTDDRLIAAAAIIGDSRRPVTGYSSPAAIGTPSAL
jgi:hypothetical protein